VQAGSAVQRLQGGEARPAERRRVQQVDAGRHPGDVRLRDQDQLGLRAAAWPEQAHDPVADAEAGHRRTAGDHLPREVEARAPRAGAERAEHPPAAHQPEVGAR
jgi:hypothetical protein